MRDIQGEFRFGNNSLTQGQQDKIYYLFVLRNWTVCYNDYGFNLRV